MYLILKCIISYYYIINLWETYWKKSYPVNNLILIVISYNGSRIKFFKLNRPAFDLGMHLSANSYYLTTDFFKVTINFNFFIFLADLCNLDRLNDCTFQLIFLNLLSLV